MTDVTPGVFFDPTSYTVNEDTGVATLTVRTNVPGGPVDGAVQFYTEDGSATGMIVHRWLNVPIKTILAHMLTANLSSSHRTRASPVF